MPLTGEIEEQYGEKGCRPVFRGDDGQVPMDVMVERVARAMFEVHHESLGLPASEAAWEVTGSAWRECARTAIDTLTKKPPAVGPAAEVIDPLGEVNRAAIT